VNNSKTVFVSGHFNVLHPGHIRLLRFAKQYGTRLIVGVESDRIAGRAAHISEKLRLDGVLSNIWVDDAFIIDEPVVDVIARIKPDVVVKGKEHEKLANPELNILEVYGGKLLFSSGDSSFSSVDLLRKEIINFDPRTIEFPGDYLNRHKIDSNQITKVINRFGKLRICVIGDLIVDEYITCQPLGMSQEDPTIVVSPIDSVKFLGGAGIVSAHAAGLGASVEFFTVIGADAAGEFAASKLNEYGIKANLFIDDSRPTTLKQRYRSKGKSLLRVSHLHQDAVALNIQNSIFTEINRIIRDIDVLVFSDFNYGVLPQALVDKIINLARENSVFIAADSQSSSQVGDIGRFKGADLITPTEHEARICTKNYADGLVVLAEKLRQLTSAKNILLKLGEEGLLIHSKDACDSSAWVNDKIIALNSSPKDTAGAGDSLLITSAMSMAVSGNIWLSASLGSIAAAIQVGRVGNTPLRVKELLRELD
jgi:rfaE bifunctional protein kinase chain/domain